MLASADFKELLSLFAGHKVRYLIIGGYAVMKYSEPRFTKDLDILIAADRENAGAVYAALKEFGAPLEELTPEDFARPGYFYQMGRAPFRVDIMMSVPGITFEEAWKNREDFLLDDLSVPFISRADLIRTKEAAGSPQDLIDAENLRQSEDL
jgi:hypothetical protein